MERFLNLFSLLSDKTRLRILLLLSGKELCVCDIFAALDMSQPRVSRQLALLKQAGVIRDRREGKWIHYSIDESSFEGCTMSILSMITRHMKNDKTLENDKTTLQKMAELKEMTKNCCCNIKGGKENGE